MRGASYAQKKNILDRFSDFIVKQIKENRTRFFTVIGFTIGVILFAVFVFWRMQTINYSASDKISSAFMFYGQGNAEQGQKALLETIANYPNSPASYEARLVVADIFTADKKFDEALPYLADVAENAKVKAMKPLAAYRIMYIYDSKKDYDKAVSAADDFIKKFPDSFLIKDAYMNLARFYTLKNSPENAKRVYSDILVKFPATYEAEIAQAMLNKMKE
ncbi:MAG: tetratricopeptide repeat protein [Endomicrobia bacterium]|nr:tetratricopeptide repeat protein [Endomicrobiia bacterium]